MKFCDNVILFSLILALVSVSALRGSVRTRVPVSFGIKTLLFGSSSQLPDLPPQPKADDFNDGVLGTEIGGPQFNEYEMDPLDAYPTGMEDEEILDSMRNARQVSNDLWQSTMFRDTMWRMEWLL